MKSFLAIVKLTLRNALRSHIFQLLLLLLLLAVVVIPTTVTDDATAGGFIRVSLFYSLSMVSAILGVSSVWLGCFVMTQDIDSYQLHMVVTKPVSRIRIWLAKWTGVFLLHVILLFLATLAIYGIIMYKYGKLEFSAQEQEKIRSEVLVGRRSFLPDRRDYDQDVRPYLDEKIKRLQMRGQEIDFTPENQDRMLREARRELVTMDTELAYGQTRPIQFSNLPEGLDKPLFLRYRVYVGKIASEGQRMTRGLWHGGLEYNMEPSGPVSSVFEQNAPARVQLVFGTLSEYPEQIMSGEFHEKVLPPEWNLVLSDRSVRLIYQNLDDLQENQYFQPSDGPRLLIEVCGFFENYLRAVAVIALQLLILSGLGCVFGGLMTLPTAIFVGISYMLFGSFAVYMANLSYVSGTMDQIGQVIARLLLLVIIPLQAFDVTGLVSTGEIVEFSYMWALFRSYFIYRALPLFALGVILYRRRELGLVIRK